MTSGSNPQIPSAAPWRQGITLRTAQTSRWTQAEVEANDLIEKRLVFVNFSGADAGKARRRIATFERAEDARRTVACVNACAGKSTEQLEMVAAYDATPATGSWEPSHPIFNICQENDDLKMQRAKLLAALILAVADYRVSQRIGAPMLCEWISGADAAIAAAGGAA